MKVLDKDIRALNSTIEAHQRVLEIDVLLADLNEERSALKVSIDAQIALNPLLPAVLERLVAAPKVLEAAKPDRVPRKNRKAGDAETSGAGVGGAAGGAGEVSGASGLDNADGAGAGGGGLAASGDLSVREIALPGDEALGENLEAGVQAPVAEAAGTKSGGEWDAKGADNLFPDQRSAA